MLAVLVGIGVIWFALLGYRDLLQPDEGRYAEIPREMVATGDWLTPRLDSFKYFEKPAAQYWLTAVGYKIFGEGNATARLWPALLGFLTLPWIMWLGTRLIGPRAGLYAGLILASTFLWAVLGHTLTLDMGVSAFLTFGIGALLVAQQRRGDPKAVRNWMLLGWTMLSVAMLWKGLIALVLPGGAVFFYSLWMRDFRWWRHLHLGKGLVLFTLISAPWFIAVDRVNPGFAKFFFLHEHLERFAENTYHYGEPWWYYLPLLFVAALPWLATTAGALFKPGFDWRVARAASPQERAFEPLRFLWVYAVFTVVFFSLSHSKLLTYLLPIYPALALIAGERLARQPRFRLDTAVIAVFGLLMLSIAFNLQRFVKPDMPLEVVMRAQPWALASGAAFLVGAIAAVGFRRRGTAAATALALGALLGFQCIVWGYQPLASIYSARVVANAIEPVLAKANRPGSDRAGAEVPIYNIGRYDQSLPFYLNRTVRLGLYEGELGYGIRQEPEKYIATLEQFAEQWKQLQGQAVAVIAPPLYAKLNEQGIPMHVIYKDARRVVVTRQ